MNRDVIHQDSLDKEDWQECLAGAPKIQRLTERTSALETVADLAADVFASFYQPNPHQNEEVAPSHFINQKLIERFNESAGYHQLRQDSVNDKFGAAICTSFITERMIAEIPDDLKNLAKQIQQLQEADEPTGTDIEAITRQLNEQIQTVSDAARLAMKEAKEELETFTTAMAGFSLTGEGNPATSSYEGKLALYSTFKSNPQLQRIMTFAGRAIRIALQTQREKTIYPPTETVSVKLGNDLTKTLPSEFGYLADEETEILFFLKYVSGTLLNYDQIGHEHVGQGPIILALDESGSMTNKVIGESLAGTNIKDLTREEWSKGIMLALHSIAKKQKRDFCVIHYSSTGQIKTEVFDEGAADPQSLIQTINHFFNGGTDFEPWMKKAGELITESQWDKADVIVISDGLTHIPEKSVTAWNKIKAERNFRSYGILIGTEQGKELLNSICNETFTLVDMFNEATTLKTVFGL